MKKIVLVLALAMISSPAKSTANDELCETLGVMAAGIMAKRQADGMYGEMMRAAKVPDAFSGVLQIMVEQAFEEPRYYSREYIEIAVAEFSNGWARACYRSGEGSAKGPRLTKVKKRG